MPNTNATTTASEALEAALRQMDGILSTDGLHPSGSSNTTSIKINGVDSIINMQQLSERSLISAANVLSTAKTLAMALDQVGATAPAPDQATAMIIIDWLETHIPRQDTDERLRRLQRDKESLAVQYQVLADRVSEQTDKIIELERLLHERTQLLGVKEEQLQRQMLSRSALETQKLELMSALSELKLHRAALERENVEMDAATFTHDSLRRSPFSSLGNLTLGSRDVMIASTKTPQSALRDHILPQFHSLPRSHVLKYNNNNNIKTNNKNNRSYDGNANSTKRNVMFASNEKILIDDALPASSELCLDGSFNSKMNNTPSPKLRERSAKGLRNIFGKLRHSNSGNLELPNLEQAEPEFKRGGARATTAGRIEWSTQTSQLSSSSSRDYADWSPQEVCNWLSDLGLGCYEDDCKKWLKNNPSVNFFTASPLDIEKELGLKLPLHRKKILLAIDELSGKESDLLALSAAQLDVGWVMRWLDDIGLPQYKDSFMQAKVDGACLHRLTMEDLAQLHVSSCLHIASLRRGIQCMRDQQWHAECLIRRSTKLADESEESPVHRSVENVALWTAHRVMEWLRVADLSEYAPNLRGAGVHGALMLHEARFNANLLADLLSIPPSKTLLRRHLATHFKELLGREVIQTKRDAEELPGYQALTTTAKLKPPKKTQFSLKRRKSTKGNAGDIEWTDYVCPMTGGVGGCTDGDGSCEEQQQTNNASTEQL